MIEKMTKYSFVLMDAQKDEFLARLQDLGLVDITRSEKAIDERSSAMFAEIDSIRAEIAAIESVRDAHVGELETSLKALRQGRQEIEPWGEYDMNLVQRLNLHFYRVKEKQFDQEWENAYALELVDKIGDKVYFVIAGNNDGFPMAEMPRPQSDLREYDKRISDAEKELLAYKAGLESRKVEIPALQEKIEVLSSELMRYLAAAAGDSAADKLLAVFEGYAPTKEDARLKPEFDAMDIYWEAEEASEQDNPPIKLRNNRFSKLFEVITGMYGMPVYGEFDPTPILAIFFLLFFGMCMGDAGYGLLLIIFGILESRNVVKIDMFKGLGPIITVLGAGTLAIGLVLGTAFGINLYEASWYPAALKGFMISDSIKIAGFSAQMILAIGIGILHICLAIVTKAILFTKRFGFRQTISTWGWTILIIGGLLVTAGAMTSLLSETAVKWSVIAIATVSALGIFIFNTPGRNPLVNIGAGLWDSYNMVTGLLGDVLSYIRLYALGLAGGMLGNAFNTLGMMVMGGSVSGATWQWPFFILILLFGHTLNLLMSCLGAFVHPLRLTFVEYFKNAGYEGKGRVYRPLSN